MQIEDYSLNDSPFSDHFVIQFPFPQKHRNELVENMEDIPDSVLWSQIENSRKDILEREIANRLGPLGYYYSKDHPEKCQLWRPDYKHEADFYNPERKISVEVEITERKRVVHDVLKCARAHAKVFKITAEKRESQDMDWYYKIRLDEI